MTKLNVTSRETLHERNFIFIHSLGPKVSLKFPCEARTVSEILMRPAEIEDDTRILGATLHPDMSWGIRKACIYTKLLATEFILICIRPRGRYSRYKYIHLNFYHNYNNSLKVFKKYSTDVVHR